MKINRMKLYLEVNSCRVAVVGQTAGRPPFTRINEFLAAFTFR